jgi:hypothetical protein
MYNISEAANESGASSCAGSDFTNSCWTLCCHAGKAPKKAAKKKRKAALASDSDVSSDSDDEDFAPAKKTAAVPKKAIMPKPPLPPKPSTAYKPSAASSAAAKTVKAMAAKPAASGNGNIKAMFAAKSRPSSETLFDTTSADDDELEVAGPSTSACAAKPAAKRAGTAKPGAKAPRVEAEGSESEGDDNSDIEPPRKKKVKAPTGKVVASKAKAAAKPKDAAKPKAAPKPAPPPSPMQWLDKVRYATNVALTVSWSENIDCQCERVIYVLWPISRRKSSNHGTTRPTVPLRKYLPKHRILRCKPQTAARIRLCCLYFLMRHGLCST